MQRYAHPWLQIAPHTSQSGGQEIAIAQSYVYLGVTMTDDLDFTTHISQLKHKLDTQKREAILLGAKSGDGAAWPNTAT